MMAGRSTACATRKQMALLDYEISRRSIHCPFEEASPEAEQLENCS